jgi:hypothetical protein
MGSNARTKLHSDTNDRDIAVTVFAVAVIVVGLAAGRQCGPGGGSGVSLRRQRSTVG